MGNFLYKLETRQCGFCVHVLPSNRWSARCLLMGHNSPMREVTQNHFPLVMIRQMIHSKNLYSYRELPLQRFFFSFSNMWLIQEAMFCSVVPSCLSCQMRKQNKVQFYIEWHFAEELLLRNVVSGCCLWTDARSAHMEAVSLYRAQWCNVNVVLVFCKHVWCFAL